MKLENLTEQHLLDIIRLYEQHCGFGRGFRETMYQIPSAVLESLRENKREEYRIGSRWSGHSKIYFEANRAGDITIRFNSNFDPKDRSGQEYNEAEIAGEIFVQETMKYLDAPQPARE